MTAKEKAEELVDKIYYIIGKNYSKSDGFSLQLTNEAKQCALIAVDEILNNFGQLTDGANFYTSYNTIKFYKQVKKEIEKL